MVNHKGFPVFGISPLGGNSKVDSTIEGVPLFYSAEVDAYVSEQAIEELADRELTLQKRLVAEEEERFRANAGYKK